MEKQLDNKIKNLKQFIKNKTDLGTSNYLGKEIREICGIVETQSYNRGYFDGANNAANDILNNL